MPANQHLHFIELTDFTPGLYDRISAPQGLNMPDNAAQEMVDVTALPGGGMRAFYKPSTFTTSGITGVATERLAGLGLHSAITLRDGSSDGADFYLSTVSDADTKTRLYRMDTTAGDTTWGQDHASYTRANGAANGFRPHTFFPFFDTSGNRWMIWVMRSSANADSGIYKILYDEGNPAPVTDGVLTRMALWLGPAVANQARIIVGQGINPDDASKVYYSDVGETTGFTSYLDVAPYQQGSGVMVMVPQEPSDLLMGRVGAPWVRLQGAISNIGTAVRELGAVHHPINEQDPARTPDGIVYVENSGHAYLTNGNHFTNISGMLAPFGYTIGRAVFINNYLYLGGYVRDWETGGWFKQSGTAGSVWYWQADARTQRVIGGTPGLGFSLVQVSPFDAGAQRWNTYTWRSAMFTQQDGRQTRIREVEVYMRAFYAGSITVTRTDAAGTTVARTQNYSAGTQKLRFQFTNVGSEYQDIKIVPTSTSTSHEAPMIERIRIGMAGGKVST